MQLSVVVAPDSFKGSLAAAEAAECIARGWSSIRPGDAVTVLPQADGGEGTLDAIEAAAPGAVRRAAGLVTGPDHRPVPGYWLELPGRVAVVELASVSGLPLMHRLDPEGATTRGLGEVVLAALASGAHSLIIALGGSASTDGGTGALAALGLQLRGADGAILPDGGGALARLAIADRSRLVDPPPGGVVLLTDVTAPLLGPAGAAAVFGPQKGADEAQVARLDAALSHLAGTLGGAPGAAGSGAAGGTAYGFATLWGAGIRPGADHVAGLTGLTAALATADVLLTGEGRFDEQSLTGKVVGSALALAARLGVRPGVIAGQVAVAVPGTGTGISTGISAEPVWTASLTELAGSTEDAMLRPREWLVAAGAEAARALG